MATVFTKDKPSASESSQSLTEVTSIEPLGIPVEGKHFWFQRTKGADPNSVATQVLSLFDSRHMTLNKAS